MLLSILIPTYNNAGTLRKCVESALNQDYDDEFEVIVSNNASTDETADILSSFKDNRLRVITNIDTVCLEANHNILLREAKSDYVVFLHSDDELLPDALKIFSHRIRERLCPKKYIVYGHSIYGDVSEWTAGQNSMLGYNTMFSGLTAVRIMLSGATPQPTGTCYSRESILQLGGFEETNKFIMQDWLLAEKAAFNYFEFEIMDRIVLKREYSSIDSKLTAAEREEAVVRTHQILWDSLNERQRDLLEQLWGGGKIPAWNEFFRRLITKKEKIDKCRQKIKRNPYRVRSWVKLLAVYIGCK